MASGQARTASDCPGLHQSNPSCRESHCCSPSDSLLALPRARICHSLRWAAAGRPDPRQRRRRQRSSQHRTQSASARAAIQLLKQQLPARIQSPSGANEPPILDPRPFQMSAIARALTFESLCIVLGRVLPRGPVCRVASRRPLGDLSFCAANKVCVTDRCVAPLPYPIGAKEIGGGAHLHRRCRRRAFCIADALHPPIAPVRADRVICCAHHHTDRTGHIRICPTWAAQDAEVARRPRRSRPRTWSSSPHR